MRALDTALSVSRYSTPRCSLDTDPYPFRPTARACVCKTDAMFFSTALFNQFQKSHEAFAAAMPRENMVVLLLRVREMQLLAL